MPRDSTKADRAHFLAALVAAAAFAIVYSAQVSMSSSLGYDEAMHAEAPAARMLVAVGMGEWGTAKDALLGCEQYPFAYPLLLALVQACTGLSEVACRAMGRVLLAIALLGIFRLAQRTAGGIGKQGQLAHGRARWAPWIALLAVVLSPLAIAYSGTLFLEVPFMAASAWAAVAWLARQDAHPSRAARLEVLAGGLLALAFFTKFNYGILLFGGCALDFGLDGIAAYRRRDLRPWLLSAARLAALPALALFWWFVLPLPGGFESAASHRATFWSFLLGNQELVARKSIPQRVTDWAAGVFLTPRAFVAAGAACLLALRFRRVREVRSVAILALAFVGPTSLHPYHLDRFLLPGAVFVWVLAALGFASLLPRSPFQKIGVVAAALILCLLRPDLDTRPLGPWVKQPESPALAEYQRTVLAQQIALSPSRPLPTAGLTRGESNAALEAFEGGLGRDLHVGWLGAPEKLPPGALQLGLVERGGPRARFLDDPSRAMVLGVSQTDPGWSDEQLAAACAPFDVLLAHSSAPPDAFGPPTWAFVEGYRQRLTAKLGYVEQELGTILVHKPLGQERSVRLFALRRSP